MSFGFSRVRDWAKQESQPYRPPYLEALQQATGRNVAASTGPVGAAVLGGTWTLDATTGPTPDALPANLAIRDEVPMPVWTATLDLKLPAA